MAKPNTVFFTRKHLIQAARLGQKWNFNRQLCDEIAEVPDVKFPVEAFLVHNHRNGVRCEPHIRCMISLTSFDDGAVFCDVPTNYFKKLPKMRSKRPTQFLGER